MKIIAEHEVSNDKTHCWDGDSGGYYNECKYMKNRDRRYKDGKEIKWEYKKPKCTLFDEWLEKDFSGGPFKCNKCLNAMKIAE